MTADQVQILVILVTLAVAAYAVYEAKTIKGTALTPGLVVDEIKSAVPVALQVKEIVQTAVNSAEQLKREGSIKTNDEAFNHALDLAKQWIPPEWQVNNGDIINFINAAVLTSSALARQAGASSQHGTGIVLPQTTGPT